MPTIVLIMNRSRLDEYTIELQFSKSPESYVDMKEALMLQCSASMQSWLIAKRTLIVLNHTRVLTSIVAVLSDRPAT